MSHMTPRIRCSDSVTASSADWRLFGPFGAFDWHAEVAVLLFNQLHRVVESARRASEVGDEAPPAPAALAGDEVWSGPRSPG